jgi:H+-translocating NAD(P) transhydrogenase subunit alpha
MSEEFIKAEMELFATQAQEVDIIITTALIPGKKAPVLLTQAMVESMKEGSVIIDMAAEQGGNCACTRPGDVYSYKGVTIVGLTDLPSRMAQQASQLYGINLYHVLEEMGGAKNYKVDRDNEVIRGALIVHNGEITWPPPPKTVVAGVQGSSTPAPFDSAQGKPLSVNGAEKDRERGGRGDAEIKGKKDTDKIPVSERPSTPASSSVVWLLLVGSALVGIGVSAPASFLSHLIVFVLACFVGWQVIWNVKPALHTPLMSVTNAISGIIIIGGMLQLSGGSSSSIILGAIAILVGTINISGGFLVTQRMLRMFQK